MPCTVAVYSLYEPRERERELELEKRVKRKPLGHKPCFRQDPYASASQCAHHDT